MSRKSKAAEFIDEGYEIHVTGRNVLVTEAMKAYAIEKIQKIEKFSTRIIDVQVTMDIQKLEHRVDIVLKVGHLKIKGSAADKDMYAATDTATDRIARQLRRYKTRIQDHQTKSLNSIDMNVNVLKPTAVEDLINDEIDDVNQKELMEKYRPHELVTKETVSLKTLSTGEAIMKMELSDDVFLVYRSEEDRKLKVIYRRNDGNFGMIEPEA